MMDIWLTQHGEELPIDGRDVRLVRTAMLADMLSQAGHRVTWWASTFSHVRKVSRFDEDTVAEVNDNYTIRMLYAKPYMKNISFARILHYRHIAGKFYAQAPHLPKPDIIVASMPSIDLAYQAVRFANEHGVVSVVDIRDIWPDIFADYFPKALAPLVRIATKGMDRRVCKAFSGASAITSMADYGVNYGVKKAGRERRGNDRLFYLAYPDNAKKPSGNPDMWIDMGVSPEKTVVVFFGSIANSSNLDHVIDAARLIRGEPVQFVICGDGELLPGLKHKAQGLDNVFFPGIVSSEDIASLARIAKAGIMPYKKQSTFSIGFPNKFAEYLCFGLPVLLHTDGEMLGFVAKHKCGYPYDTAEELADKISQLANDPQEYKEASENARRMYLEEFEAGKVYGSMISYLEEMAAGKS